ncbi:MAG: FAD-binding protein [Eudoraea sp.]|nr:FAD-binding protein [Eudoraea sp.]
MTDDLSRMIYSTDASVYRKTPLAVAYPRSSDDLKELISFASDREIGLVPRTAGTSLAGQCVGDGIIVDVSRYFTEILKLDPVKKQVTVQPGVVRDELNIFLRPHGLFFGPNTSTSNRCMIGGMVGNNSSGTTSIKYGVTRDKVISVKGLLSDGSEVTFENLDSTQIRSRIAKEDLEANIYKKIVATLQKEAVRSEIRSNFPKPEIHRRNTGYAVDSLLEYQGFGGDSPYLNLGKLIAGSEGTLFFITEITLQLDDLPPKYSAMIVPHYNSLESCLNDVAPAMAYDLYLCEMMDKVILDCTKDNRTQLPNRFFVEGDPKALLMLELKDVSEEGLNTKVDNLLETLNSTGASYAMPVLRGPDIQKAITLRKAGLGLLGNMVGDKKAVACIEDTAVAIEDLSAYISEFTGIMTAYDQQAVYYAHAGAGELHLRPILDLKKSTDVLLFREITTKVAELVKKYNGSFSGEHGDGIVRAEFIEYMIGSANFEVLRQIKSTFDPKGVFNPGKIVAPYPMDQALRYETDRTEPEIETLLDFSDSQGILRAAEKCNGSGDCRKSHQMPGAMCPSFQATRNERHTTRARANALREVLTNSTNKNRFDSKELKEVFDLCISCKACASECPSNVDAATLKAEFLYQHQKTHGNRFRDRLFARSTKLNRVGSKSALLINALHRGFLSAPIFKWIYGVAQKRRLPKISSFNFNKHLYNAVNQQDNNSEIILFIDEFTLYQDIQVGKDAIDLLAALGYRITLYFGDSGRALISKGFLSEAKSAASNVLNDLDSAANTAPIIGLEPSAILTLRDEFTRFGLDTEKVIRVKKRTFLLEEFLASEMESGNISSEQFTTEERIVHVHGHCHQKALSDPEKTLQVLGLAANYKIQLIPSGCCGMAGSFGYEKEHYSVSMDIGNLVLFPHIRAQKEGVLFAANGTSCRHQILDGTEKHAEHPATILKNALRSS